MTSAEAASAASWIDWRDGSAMGQGVFNHSNGDIYTGQFINDQANGKGNYVHKNGQKYDGQWKNDK